MTTTALQHADSTSYDMVLPSGPTEMLEEDCLQPSCFTSMFEEAGTQKAGACRALY